MAATRSDERYPTVFTPIKLGPVEIPNRIFFSPHGIPLEAPTPGYESHDVPAVEHALYFAERAAGGAALIVHSTQLGPFAAHAGLRTSPGLKEGIPSYRRVAELVHEQGAKIMAEIWYVPWQQHRWDALGPEAPSLAPSALQNFNSPNTRYAMRKDDIRRFIQAHVPAAENLREAGYDGIELHVSHGSTLEYFLSPYFNRRTDEYGGGLENRARLLRETLEVTREAAGDRLAVGIRLTTDQLLEGGWNSEGAREILEHLSPTGLLDFVDLDISVEPEQDAILSTSYFEPKLHNAPRVAIARTGAGPNLPVLATPGRVTNLSEAERLLADGTVDMVGIVRGLIAEPNLVANAREGRENESRICIAANHCAGGNLGFGCAINPAAAREGRWGRRHQAPASRSQRVVVAGGGPAGLEAARVAATRGHTVTLLEQSDHLGGGLALWARIPAREHLATLPAWFERRLSALGVDVRMETEAAPESVLALEPDVVFVATGSHYDPKGESGYAPRPVPGWDRDFVHTPEPVIDRSVKLSGRVIVLEEEGYHAAAGAAEIAHADGCEVEIVTRLAAFGTRLGRDSGYVVRRLARAGITMTTTSYVTDIGNHRVTIRDVLRGTDRVVDDVSAVVLATMRSPVDALADSLEGQAPYVWLIGDALSPRSLREATYEGHRFARAVGEEGMPGRVTEEVYKPLNTLHPAAMA